MAKARKEAARAQTLARQVLEATAAELQPAELERAKAQAKAGLLMGLESVQARCDHLARQLMIYRSEEHTSELPSLMRISYAVFCLKQKKHYTSYKTHDRNIH